MAPLESCSSYRMQKRGEAHVTPLWKLGSYAGQPSQWGAAALQATLEVDVSVHTPLASSALAH